MKRTAKKLLGLLLAVVLVAGMLPAGTVALAADATEVITFVGGTSYIYVNEVTDYGLKSQNLNWKFFDWSGNWNNYLIRQSSQSNAEANDLRLKADVDSDGVYKAWLALKIDFQNEALTPGVYSLSVKTTYREAPSNGTAGAKFWFAEADSTTSAADYMTATNLIKEADSSDPFSTATGTNVLAEDIIINDPTAEHVLVVQYESDMRLSIEDFTFTRIDDIPTGGDTPEEELATDETFAFKNSGSSDVEMTTYADYGTAESDNPNWKYFSHQSDWAGNHKVRRGSASSNANTFRIAVNATPGKAWTSLKLDPENNLAPGVYSLSMTTTAVYTYSSGSSTDSISFWFAEADSSITSGEGYKTADNLVATKSSVGSGTTVTLGEVKITDGNAEYILVIELEGKEYYISNFTLTRTGELPTVELATEETFTFDGATNATLLYDGSYDATGTANPNWAYFDRAASFKAETDDNYAKFAGLFYKSSKYSGYGFIKLADWDTVGGTETWTALKLTPQNLQTGKYKLTFDMIQNIVQNRDSHGDRHISVYFAEYVDGQNDGEYYKTEANLIKPLGTVTTTNEATDSYIADIGSFHITNSDAEYVLIIEVQGAEMWLHDFTLTREGDTPDSDAEVAFSKNPLRIGEIGGAALTIDGEKVISSAITFSTTDDAVIVTKAGTITSVKSGEATITATCGDITADATITVLTDELLSGNVSVYVKSLVDGVADEDGITADNGITVGNINSSVSRGKSITLTATGIEGKEFKYWQLASGIILSEEEIYDFNANSNTAIFGVYESEADADDGADVTVRFFNGFGSFIQKVVKAKGTLFSEFASAVTDKDYKGYTFASWMNADDSITDETPINKNDVVVAQYEENPEEIYNVTGIVNPGKYAYDEVVMAESTDADFSYWTRNDEVISYNPTYTFSVWGETNVKAICDGAATAAPAIILDSDNSVYMVEYSLPEGYTFIEAGIVFSNSGTPSINSCTSKASSKKLSGLHGQFTARPAGNETKARGYVIYRDTDGDLVASYSK